MAEENPHIEITIPQKPINNPREKYFSENEKLILGRHGMIYKSFPTLKDRYKEFLGNNRYDIYNMNINNNSCNIKANHSLSRKILKNPNIINNNSQLYKCNSQDNIFLQPILRFKNRTDLERICDTVQKNATRHEQESIKEIRARHVKAIDFSKGNMNINKGNLRNIIESNNNSNLNTNSLTVRNHKRYLFDDNKIDNIIKKKPKLGFNRLQRLNAEAKKIRSNLHFKIHFKGVESVFINPKQIYNINKKENKINKQKIENYAFNDRREKEAIEKNNEYKSDIDELIAEEKEKQEIINTREFSNILNNRNFYEYKDSKNKNKNNIINENDKIKKMNDINYLKKLAFKKSNSADNSQYLNENGEENTDYTNNDLKFLKKTPLFENEQQLRIGGKIYHLKNEIDKIAKEVLNKCNVYNYKK